MPRTVNTIRQDQFIAEYIENGGVRSKAATKLDIPDRTVNFWFKDKRFLRRLTRAKCKWREMLHAAGIRRAIGGSDRLLEYFLNRYDKDFDPGIRKLRFLKRNAMGQFVKKEEPGGTQPTTTVINLYSGPVPADAGPDHSEESDEP